MRAGLCVQAIYLVIYILLGFWDLSLEDSRGKVSSFSWQLCTEQGLWARQLGPSSASCLSLLQSRRPQGCCCLSNELSEAAAAPSALLC